MSKYAPLGSYLRAQPTANVPMTFSEIEKVLGFSLPAVAKSARAWWSNNPSNNVMTKVWTEAGFKSEQVDMSSERLVFRRREARPTAPTDFGPAGPDGGSAHPLFGWLKGMASVAPGVDLTAPAEDRWSESTK